MAEEVVFNYDIVSLMDEAQKEPAARIVTLDYILIWDGYSWTIYDTATQVMRDVYISVA